MDNVRDAIIRKVLSENDVGAMLFWRPDEIVMATGYLPVWGISLCVYPAIGMPILYVPELEPVDQLPDGFLIKTFPWGRLDCKNPWDVLYGLISEDLERFCINELPISFLKYASQSAPAQISAEGAPLPFTWVEELLKLAKGGYKDIQSKILGLYLIKTPVEIEQIRLVNQVTSLGIKAFYSNLRPGITEAELASAVETEIQSQTGKSLIKYAKAWPYIMSGSNSAFGGTFARNSGKALNSGEIVMIEMAVCVNGYWCDITRTGAVGAISAKQQELFSVVLEAQILGLGLIKPGVKASEVDKIVRLFIQEKGFGQYYQHGLGHHVGFRYHDPGEGFFPDSELILEEGMVLTVEPGIYMKEFDSGVRIENNILITKSGVEILSDFSMELNGL
jgi:Xaa-Pro dipeptidase